MRVPARSSSRTRWWQSFALIGCATCLSGAYFRTCGGPTHGVQADVYATARSEEGAAFTEMGVTSVVGQLVGQVERHPGA